MNTIAVLITPVLTDQRVPADGYLLQPTPTQVQLFTQGGHPCHSARLSRVHRRALVACSSTMLMFGSGRGGHKRVWERREFMGTDHCRPSSRATAGCRTFGAASAAMWCTHG